MVEVDKVGRAALEDILDTAVVSEPVGAAAELEVSMGTCMDMVEVEACTSLTYANT